MCAGEEKGYFEYGGSTIVIITEDKHELSENVKNRAKIGEEIPVTIGEPLINERRR